MFNDPELSKYADLFEFMDIPGLTDDNNNFYLQTLFPYFVYNIKFCFFIFDSSEYHGNNSLNLFNKVLSFFETRDDIVKNSLFIFNKYDLPTDKKLAINNLKNISLKL